MAISVAILGRLIAAILHLFNLLAMDTQMNSKYVHTVWAKLVLQSLHKHCFKIKFWKSIFVTAVLRNNNSLMVSIRNQ